ncbi:hypothetical protein EDD16DRAFT_1525816 [Pisolithus croceorrhizus]|nr:hypothetical protein EDD16DRAFT_1525816 [Pisolithus croceorrhizus]KAI6120235.1 hypothetical protein EV401DRAFT_1887740 [Pisolithus croceorrhizus]KAI6169878.1 hypothetical protein EDD17DRAFT_1502778 [Pisolithus thermaeus]
MTKAMSVSSATSDLAALAYRRTPMPVLNSSPDDKNKNGMQDSTASLVWIVGHRQAKMAKCTTTNENLQESDDNLDRPISETAWAGTKHKHTGYHNSVDPQYIASEVNEADNEGSDIGHDNADTCLLPPAKAPCVTTMTNIITNKPVKKPWTNQHGDTMAKGSRHLTSTPAHSSQVSSITTNSASSGCLCYINGHLPPTLQEDRKWTKQVLPALVTWVGSLGNPWVIPDQDMM